MATRKRLTRAERREVIERAATEVFAEHGYGGASIDEIAARSGVSAPVVYDHFASKEDLYRRLLERQRDDLVAFWAARLPLPEGRDALEALIDAYYQYVEAHPFAYRMYFRDTEHRDIQQQGVMMLAALLATVPGFENAGQAISYLKLVASVPKPTVFVDPAYAAGLQPEAPAKV
jgi:AcrR family transcriptional regulator